MGLEPTTFCVAIVWAIRINAWFCGFRLNPITGDYRGFARYWSPQSQRPVDRAVTSDPTGLVPGGGGLTRMVPVDQCSDRHWLCRPPPPEDHRPDLIGAWHRPS